MTVVYSSLQTMLNRLGPVNTNTGFFVRKYIEGYYSVHNSMIKIK